MTGMQTLELPFELRSLSKSHRYQHWLADLVRPHLGERILEVGAGIGNLSQHLPLRKRLILTETDESFLPVLRARVGEVFGTADARVSVTAVDLSKPVPASLMSECLDTIVSFNVLEHIENDFEAIHSLARVLNQAASGKPRRIVSVVPAHKWALGGMDRTFGHFRRYDRARFREIQRQVLPHARLTTHYFNRIGLAGWWVNGKLLGREKIGEASIDTFEKLCPLFRWVDAQVFDRLGLPLGQSILSVFEWTGNIE